MTLFVFLLLSGPLAWGWEVTTLHEFTGGANDGSSPLAGLTLVGSTLYGMTQFGGDSNGGTIFSIGADGNGFTLLREFAGGGSDGYSPYGGLTAGGSTLYGMTNTGGDSHGGTIFSIGADGSGFTLLHEFAGGSNDGLYPVRSLTLSGSTLYGMTIHGGDSDVGTIFSIGTDGNDFELLHEFTGGANGGAYPYGNLILSGSTLYGTTYGGGDNDAGTIFSVGTDGNGFGLLHEFAGGAADGSHPTSTLTLSGTTLFGTTQNGGDNNAGTVFSVETSGDGFALLHEFAGGGNDGAVPYGGLTLDGSMLYGMTRDGGDGNLGTIFIVTPEPGTVALLGLGAIGLAAWRRKRM